MKTDRERRVRMLRESMMKVTRESKVRVEN